MTSKLVFSGERVTVESDHAIETITHIIRHAGCDQQTATVVAQHLVDSSLCGVESHGLMRVLQYMDQYERGYMKPDGRAALNQLPTGAYEIDGQGGIGIPAMTLAVEHGCRMAKENGISMLAVRNAGHTGRLGAFAEQAAENDCLMIIIGGGNRTVWRQVAPYGGAQAKLPTNPYCIGIPAGEDGPVVLDFATGKIAGGWIYAAKSAGASLPQGMMIDSDGKPSVDPQDYFDGGAILPAGGAKGYALSLMAELIAEAMLGPVTVEANTLVLTIDTTRYQSPSRLSEMANEIVTDIRSCKPAPGFDRVEIPGHRERQHKQNCNGQIDVPEQTWNQILALYNTC